MASVRISKPGTQYGPCDFPCTHQDCLASRQDAERACSICGKKIGYETEFYSDGDDTKPGKDIKHAACAYIKARRA